MASIQPLVSIILSCFNSGRYLQQALDSVLGQTYQNWELIAVDDCSTDNTPEILHKAAKVDPRVKVIEHQQNRGRPSITRNTGLAAARGDFVQFIDHDDTYTPEKTALLIAALESHPDCGVAFGNMHYINAHGDTVGLYLPRFLHDAQAFISCGNNADEYRLDRRFFVFQALKYAGLHTNSCLIAKKRLPATEIRFSEDFTICEDTDLWIRTGMTAPVVYLDRVVASYRQLPDSITSDKARFHRDSIRLVQTNLSRLGRDLSVPERAALMKKLADSYDSLGWTLRCQRKHKEAFSAYVSSYRAEPNGRRVLPALKAWLPPQG